MLVLSRKVGERILIGDKIAVTVVRITGGGVRIGIEAPAEMPVIREELQKSIEQTSTPKSPASRTVPMGTSSQNSTSQSPATQDLNDSRSGLSDSNGQSIKG